MRATFLRRHRLASTFLLIAGALAWLSPLALSAQSVTFAGASPSVNFGTVNLCPAGQTTPTPCSETLTLTYNVTAGGTLGTPKALTLGSPNLDFTLAVGSTCTGAVTAGTSCTVNVKFAPLFAGGRSGAAQITDGSGKVLAITIIYGFGAGPQIGFEGGSTITLPPSFGGISMALDGAGDLFLGQEQPGQVVEVPAGGGPLTTLHFSGLSAAVGVAVDGAGNIFVADYNVEAVVELPANGGPQITLPFTFAFSGLGSYFRPWSVGVDGAGDVFAADEISDEWGDPADGLVLELPVGGGPQMTLPITGLIAPLGVAVNGRGDIFVADQITGVFELPAGVGPQMMLPFTGLQEPWAVAVDAAGDVFLTDSVAGLVSELPADGGPQITLPFKGGFGGVAVDGAGDLFVVTPGSVSELQRSQSPILNFGTTALGGNATLTLTMTNTGTGTLTIAPSINNLSFKILTPEQNTCLTGMTSGQSCALQIEFSPTALGGQNGLLTLQTNGTTTPTVSLQGATNVASPMLSLPSGVFASAQSVSITDATPGAAIYYTTNGATPTAASTPYTGAIQVMSTERLTALAIVADTPSAIATAAYVITSAAPAGIINFSQGLADARGPMQFNGSTDLDGSRLQLTNGGTSEASSAFFVTPVNIQSFTTDFTFQLSNPAGDGITFTIQNAGSTALGGDGGGLGYSNIPTSVAIKFDLFNNSGEGSNSTGLYVDGAHPSVHAINLTGTGIDLHSGDTFTTHITYDGTDLQLTLTDTVTLATWSHSFTINIPSTVGDSTAFVGFTGGTGGLTADQEILSWTYVAGAPGLAAPPIAPPVPNYPMGFNPAGLTGNGSASLSGTALILTSAGNPGLAGSAFYSAPMDIQSFTTNFAFQLTSPSVYVPLPKIADGITFTIQNVSSNALGGSGGCLGYSKIPRSVAIKFDLYSNAGEGPDSTGLYIDGACPTLPAIDLTGTGINLHSGDPFTANITYDGTNLTLTLTDTVTLTTWSHSFAIDIPATVGRNTAFVGFTGSTGADVATQQILNWTFTNP